MNRVYVFFYHVGFYIHQFWGLTMVPLNGLMDGWRNEAETVVGFSNEKE